MGVAVLYRLIIPADKFVRGAKNPGISSMFITDLVKN